MAPAQSGGVPRGLSGVRDDLPKEGPCQVPARHLLTAQAAEKLAGCSKRSRCEAAPAATREAYFVYVERATMGADCRASEGSARPSDGLTSDDYADGPLEASLLDLAPRPEQIPLGLPHVC